MNEFEGRVALVTGAASGIGKSIALLYAKHGAKVVVSDIDDSGGQELVEAITEEKPFSHMPMFRNRMTA